jgi:hypothetical protein
MSTVRFFDALAQLQALCFSVEAIRYDQRTEFGSWSISVAAPLPRRRLIWDGKEGCFVIETFRQGEHWTPSWTGERSGALETALDALKADSQPS